MAQDAPWVRGTANAVQNYGLSIDENVGDAIRVAARLSHRAMAGDGGWIEDGDIGLEAGLKHTSIFQADAFSR